MDSVCEEAQEIELAGWFDFEPFYAKAVETAPPGSTLVELGVFCGKSLIYLATKARESGKNLRVFGIDTFQGSPEFDTHVFFHGRPLSQCHPGTLVRECFGGLYQAGVLNDVTLIVGDSAKSAELFADGSVHMVFVDADHDEEPAYRDIATWLPKIRAGGLIGGHDIWTFPGVYQAVARAFPGLPLDESKTWWEKSC